MSSRPTGHIPWTITAVLINAEEAIDHLEKICQGKGTAGLPELLMVDLRMPGKGLRGAGVDEGQSTEGHYESRRAVRFA